MRMYSRAMDQGVILHKGTLSFQYTNIRTERKAQKSRTGAVRICGGAMVFDVDFNNGDEGNTLAVLSSPRC